MINIGICGYGNLGQAVLKLSALNKNLNVVAIFSRRQISASVPVLPLACAPDFKDKIDVMFMCGGSENDLTTQTEEFAKNFCVIDTFDTHAQILDHKLKVDKICKLNNTTAIVSCGWDPGLFSIFRTIFSLIFDNTYCFWGKGISLGHTNAIKSINGVKNAKQWTIPVKSAKKHAIMGKTINFAMHKRKCFVVSSSNKKAITQKIKTIPNYFLGQPTTVKFVSEKTLAKRYSTFKHKGEIISSGTALGTKFSAYLKLKMEHNPNFTAKIMLAYLNALIKLNKEERFGAFTPLEITPYLLTDKTINDTIKNFC